MIKTTLTILVLLSLISATFFLSNKALTFGQNKEAALGLETSITYNPKDLLNTTDAVTGEMKGLQVTSQPTFNKTNYNYPTNFVVSSQLLSRLKYLKATIFYYRIDHGQPDLQNINFNLTKLKNGQFQGAVNFPIFGCVDLKSPTDIYIASFCVKNTAIGVNRTGYVYGADTNLPFKYEQGVDVWGQNNTSMQIYYNYGGQTGLDKPQYAVQALTAAFNKNKTPYYQLNNPGTNFKPTNMYWAIQSDLPLELLGSLGYWVRPNTNVTCEAQAPRLGIFKDLSTSVAENYYSTYNWNSPDCWFRTDSSIWFEQFPNNTFLRLVP